MRPGRVAFTVLSLCLIHPLTAQGPGLAIRSVADSTFVSVFASGNVQGVATSGTSQSTVASGSLGVAVTRGRNSFWASIAVASTIDTLSSSVGSSLLNPSGGRALQSAMLQWLVDTAIGPETFRLGLQIYAAFSQSLWGDGVPKDSARSAVIVSLGVVAVKHITRGMIAGNSIALDVNAGLSYRQISGDVTSFDTLRRQLLINSRRHYPGFEGGLEIKFNKITARMQGYWYPTHLSVPGFSDGQIAGGFTLSGDIFSGTFKS